MHTQRPTPAIHAAQRCNHDRAIRSTPPWRTPCLGAVDCPPPRCVPSSLRSSRCGGASASTTGRRVSAACAACPGALPSRSTAALAFGLRSAASSSSRRAQTSAASSCSIRTFVFDRGCQGGMRSYEKRCGKRSVRAVSIAPCGVERAPRRPLCGRSRRLATKDCQRSFLFSHPRLLCLCIAHSARSRPTRTARRARCGAAEEDDATVRRRTNAPVEFLSCGPQAGTAQRDVGSPTAPPAGS